MQNSQARTPRWFRIALLLAIATVCLPTPVFADLVTLTLLNPTTPAPYGEYVDPYPIKVTSGNISYQSLLSCDDFTTNIKVGDTWTANRYLLGDLSNPVGAPTPKFTTPWTGYSVQNMYDAAALLMVHLLNTPQDRVLYSYALWYLFDPKNPPGGTVQGTVNGQIVTDIQLATNTLIAARANAPTYLYNQVYIYTPVPNSASQEFLGMVPDGGTTLLLLGGAFAGIEALRRRLRR